MEKEVGVMTNISLHDAREKQARHVPVRVIKSNSTKHGRQKHYTHNEVTH